MATNTATDLDPAYERFLGDLDSLRSFDYAERSQLGRGQYVTRGRGWMKQHDRASAGAIVVLGQMAQRHYALLDVALAVISAMNPHASIAEWNARLFSSAREVLRREYDDVEKRSGPEPFRHSECVRPYTRAEKLLVLETLRSLTDEWMGPGWAAQRAAQELGVKLPERPKTWLEEMGRVPAN